MLETIEKIYKGKEVISITCDKCLKKIDHEMEMQEVFRLRHGGGYNSVFGDGVDVECDICQHCLKEMIGGIARIVE